ncbi:hypothetical protein B0H17DRAFT_1183119 [Mycena rosella]|uniref:Uncharacterized protein n=1 Tax=Mycena rosella TaxID=1033263 RepID=A0AAD7D1C4_MYCRO|nr:hypothetical protein B0H17DRAFT_1183119 [Mycena rosella]
MPCMRSESEGACGHEDLCLWGQVSASGRNMGEGKICAFNIQYSAPQKGGGGLRGVRIRETRRMGVVQEWGDAYEEGLCAVGPELVKRRKAQGPYVCVCGMAPAALVNFGGHARGVANYSARNRHPGAPARVSPHARSSWVPTGARVASRATAVWRGDETANGVSKRRGGADEKGNGKRRGLLNPSLLAPHLHLSVRVRVCVRVEVPLALIHPPPLPFLTGMCEGQEKWRERYDDAEIRRCRNERAQAKGRGVEGRCRRRGRTRWNAGEACVKAVVQQFTKEGGGRGRCTMKEGDGMGWERSGRMVGLEEGRWKEEGRQEHGHETGGDGHGHDESIEDAPQILNFLAPRYGLRAQTRRRCRAARAREAHVIMPGPRVEMVSKHWGVSMGGGERNENAREGKQGRQGIHRKGTLTPIQRDAPRTPATRQGVEDAHARAAEGGSVEERDGSSTAPPPRPPRRNSRMLPAESRRAIRGLEPPVPLVLDEHIQPLLQSSSIPSKQKPGRATCISGSRVILRSLEILHLADLCNRVTADRTVHEGAHWGILDLIKLVPVLEWLRAGYQY